MTTITWWALPRKMALIYWKWKCHFAFLKLHPKTKGITHVAERGHHMRLQNNTHKMTHTIIKMKHSRCFLEQETWSALLSTGWFQERITVWFTIAKLLFHNRTEIVNTNLTTMRLWSADSVTKKTTLLDYLTRRNDTLVKLKTYIWQIKTCKLYVRKGVGW